MTPTRSLSHVAALVWAIFSASSVIAQDRIVSLDEQPAWDAVGRVNIGGFSTAKTCTGTLVASDLVLTAAHCVAGFRGAPPEVADRVTFVAGWNRGRYAAASTASSVTFPPTGLSLTGASVLLGDIALISLAQPITNITPLPLADVPPPSQPLNFVSYANTRLHAPQVNTGCLHRSPEAGLLFLTCGVVSGNSGSPILRGLPDQPQIVGVISSRSLTGSLGVLVNDWLRDQIAVNGG